ncbi:MAG: response regulator [Nitrospirae bacterium]|nr:response regulator [Nitrospirota bacterium]
MLLLSVISVSLFLHIIAIYYSLRMIVVTGRQKAWIFLSAGIATMGIRRLMSFIYFFTDELGHSPELGYELIGLLGSAIMLAGIVYLKPVFLSLRESEDALLESEANLNKSLKFTKSILDTIDEAFIVIDPEYRIVSANQAYLNQVGAELEAVIGVKCHKCSHHSDKPCHENGEDCSVRHTFLTGQPHVAMHIHLDKEDNNVYVETKSYPIKDDAGKVVSAIEIIIDVSEKKKLEEQLRQAQKLEAIGQLAGGIAHDFNNMLTAIMGYGSLLNNSLENDSILKSYVAQILNSAEKSADLTRQLLAFSRKQIISPRQVDLNELIKGMYKLLDRVIGEDIELETILHDEVLPVMIDPGQIEHVLMNLVTNSRDAMPDGGILSISTGVVEFDEEYCKAHEMEKPGRYALVSVTDSGKGMNEKIRQRIFEPFFTTKELGKGTGLGLSLVYGIVKQHNGNINVYSELGQGTTFKMYLPLSELADFKSDVAEVVAPRGGTETILVAEDNDEVRGLTRKVLEASGYKVIDAVDGEDAVNKFEERKDDIQLVILDVIMPRTSGKDAGERIQKIKRDIRILYVSGYTADVIRQKGILEEKTDFMSKPVSPHGLLMTVREILDRKDGAS